MKPVVDWKNSSPTERCEFLKRYITPLDNKMRFGLGHFPMIYVEQGQWQMHIKSHMELLGWEYRLFSFLKPTRRHQAAFWKEPCQFIIAEAPEAIDATAIAALKACGVEVLQ